MGLKEILILLNNDCDTYYSGQTMHGAVEITLDSPKKVRGIYIQVKGVCHTEWSKSGKPATPTDSPSTLHVGHEEYFNSKHYILGSNTGSRDTEQSKWNLFSWDTSANERANPDGNYEIELPAGKHVYKFDCALPPTLPSSFEGPFGYVRYTVKVTLERPWKFDHEKKMPFTVICALDLNVDPSFTVPLHIQMEKTYCCMCCTSSPVTVDVQSPVCSYAPGQIMPIRIHVENLSDVHIELIKIYIKQLTIYKATSSPGAKKKTEDILVYMEEPLSRVQRGVTTVIQLNKQIPPAPPSFFPNCHLIDLSYDFCVECVVSGCHANIKDNRFFMIGSVPVVEMPGQPVSSGIIPDKLPNDRFGVPAEYPPFQSLYSTLMEPVYVRGLFESRSLREKDESEYVMIQGPENFAPFYPTYEAIQPPAFLEQLD